MMMDSLPGFRECDLLADKIVKIIFGRLLNLA